MRIYGQSVDLELIGDRLAGFASTGFFTLMGTKLVPGNLFVRATARFSWLPLLSTTNRPVSKARVVGCWRDRLDII